LGRVISQGVAAAGGGIMAALGWRLGVAGVILVAIAMSLRVQPGGTLAFEPPDKPGPDSKEKSNSSGKQVIRDLEHLKNLPPGSVIVVVEEKKLKDVLRLVPKAVVLTPEEHQKLRDEITQLKAKLQPEKPQRPTECKLTGVVEGDVARLRAEFKFKKEKARVLLGCRLGQPTAVTLDGALPVLELTDEGFVVHVDKEGEHQVQLDLEVNLTAKENKAGERSFALDLPQMVITSLELDLPEGVKDVMLTTSRNREAESRRRATHADGKHTVLPRQTLGTIDSLELTWKGPAGPSTAPPILTAQALILVRLSESQLATEAELTLKALRGQPSEWRLLVPPKATVEVKPRGPEEGEPATVDAPDETTRIVHLKEPSSDPLQVIVRATHPRTKGTWPVGPFVVVGAERQRGTILIAAPAEPRPRFLPRGEVSPRDVSADDSRRDFKPIAAFSYWKLPAPDKPGKPIPPLLEVGIEPSQGTIASRVTHSLTLQQSPPAWKVRTTIQATPLAGSVEAVRVQLPAEGYQLDTELSPTEPGGRVVEIKLAQKQTKLFQVTLEATMPAPAAGARQASLELPRPLQATDRGGEVTIVLPDDLELVLPQPRGPWNIAKPQRYNSQTWRAERMPERLDIAWQPHRPEVSAAALVDLTISGSQVLVAHQLWFTSPQAPAEVRFRKPEGLNIQAVERGTAAPPDQNRPDILVVVPSEPLSEKRPLLLKYAFTIPNRPGRDGAGRAPAFIVPLLMPEQTAQGEIKVRVVSEPGVLPELVSGPWEELPLEGVEGRRLASLVLRGSRLDLPLSLRLSEGAAGVLATVGAERVLIRVRVTELGQQRCQARFLINQVSTRYLDIELPVPLFTVTPIIKLGGLDVPWGPVEAGGPRPAGNADPARVARVHVGPRFVPKLQFGNERVVLDVWYQLGPGQMPARADGWARALGPLQTTLLSPRLCGHSGRASVRWEVNLPPDWLPLYQEGIFPSPQTWSWRGWLLAPRPTASAADLERWFLGSDGLRASGFNPEVIEDAEADTAYPSLTSWRTDLEPLRITHTPQQPWLLACSLSVLAVGLGLYFLPLRRVLFWAVGLSLCLSAAVVGMFWPGILSYVLFGCEPGLIVLVLVILLQWLLYRRYRRQVVFMPGFTRLKAGSSLIRKSGSSQQRAEPSTVDALPPASSGQWATAPAPPAGSSQTKNSGA
jgi:hypothetical protein